MVFAKDRSNNSLEELEVRSFRSIKHETAPEQLCNVLKRLTFRTFIFVSVISRRFSFRIRRNQMGCLADVEKSCVFRERHF